MTKLDLKRKLKSKIDSIDNKLLLEEMMRLADMEDDSDELFELSAEQLQAVREAEQEYEQGKFVSGEEADKMIREWIEKSSGQTEH